MPSILTKNFKTLVSDQVAAIQGACNALLDFSVGSVLLSFVQANAAAVGLWLQGLVLQAITLTRAATSNGSDLDSWMADFGLTRIPAIQASGAVTFSRVTSTIATVIPVGALVSSADGTQTFTVIADTTNPNYYGNLGGYSVGVGVSSMSVTVQAVNAGTQGNVAAGAISVIKTGIAGIDTVTNSSAFTNGQNAETDSALRIRFVNFINQLSKGTPSAIGFAITSLQQNLQYSIIENKDYSGATDNGMVTVIVDDGSGNIPAGTLALATNAVNGARAAGVRVGVFGAVAVLANVQMTITTAAGFNHPTVVGLVATALTAYINSLGMLPISGNTLPYTKLEQIAYEASPGVTNVTNISLNGSTADLVATQLQTIKAGTITVS